MNILMQFLRWDLTVARSSRVKHALHAITQKTYSSSLSLITGRTTDKLGAGNMHLNQIPVGEGDPRRGVVMWAVL